jgi:hypothetical protein
MKKIIFILAFVTTLVSADVLGNVGLGYSKGNNDGNYVTAFGGLNVFGGIGLRLEYTKNVDEHKAFSKEDVSRYGLFATYSLHLLPSIAFTPKIGLVKTDGDFTLKDTIDKVSDSDTQFTYGLEVDYFLNNQFSIFVGYTDYGDELDIEHINSKDLDSSNFMVGFKLHI